MNVMMMMMMMMTTTLFIPLFTFSVIAKVDAFQITKQQQQQQQYRLDNGRRCRHRRILRRIDGNSDSNRVPPNPFRLPLSLTTTAATSTSTRTTIESSFERNTTSSFSSTTTTTTRPDDVVATPPSQQDTPTSLINGQVTTITSIDQLLTVMDDGNDYSSSNNKNNNNNDDDNDDSISSSNDRFVVIKYYASYCKICQRAGIQLKKIATEYPPTIVQFAKIEASVLGSISSGTSHDRQPPPPQQQQHQSVPATTTSSTSTSTSADVLRTLGVTKFPFVQIYRNGFCVASFSTGPSHLFVKRVRDTINLCLERTPDIWTEYRAEFDDEIQSNRKARQSLQQQQHSSSSISSSRVVIPPIVDVVDGNSHEQQQQAPNSSYLDWTKGDGESSSKNGSP
jgi:thiol-disulfide isomerase/thioredoxin